MRALTARLAAVETRIGLRTTSGNAQSLARWTLNGFIDTGPTAKIRIGPGMVNNFVPTIGGTSIVAETPPSITVTGSTGIIYLDATVDATGAITALIAANATTLPTDTSTHKYKIIGTWTASGGVFTSVNSVLNTNQTFRICGGVAEWY